MLAITAMQQLVVVFTSGSVALLADTIHSIGDATTAIPLWVTFVLVRRKPIATFNYGLGRVEDLAGMLIVLIILFSAIVAAFEAIDRLIQPQPITQLVVVAVAGVIGFIGNEAVAVFRIRVGRAMNSAALIADGYQARTDGLTSVAAVLGALGVWAGFPLADPIVGLLITIAIFGIVWQSARAVITRSLDGIDPGTLDEVRHAAEQVSGVDKVVDVKARWLGHSLHADVTIAVDNGLLLAKAPAIAATLRSELRDHLPSLYTARIQFDTEEDELGATRAGGTHAHHAPHPFVVESSLASGLLGIVCTPAKRDDLLHMGADKVVGFGHQFIKALIPPPPEGPDCEAALPGPQIMHPASAEPFQALRVKVETEWTPQMMAGSPWHQRRVVANHLGCGFSLWTAHGIRQRHVCTLRD